MAARKTSNTRKQASKASATVPLSSVVNTIAVNNESESTKVGKQLRSHIRSHFDAYQERWPAIADKSNRDGNRYGEMPRDLADELIARFTK